MEKNQLSALQSVASNESNRREVVRFFKFAIVGIGGMVTHLTIFNILRLFIPAIVANTIGFSTAVVQNFYLNRNWTFPESRQHNAGTQLGQFAIVSLIGLTINLVVFTIVSHFSAPIFANLIHDPTLAHTLSDNFALASAILVVLFWNFGANRLWTFRTKNQ